MRLSLLSFGILAALPLALGGSFLAACSTTTISDPSTDGGSADPSASGNTDPNDPINQPPHALGTIVVGEAHTAGSSAAPTPIVSASFVPDALKARACKTPIDAACDYVPRVACSDVKGSVTGCDTGEMCVVGDDCKGTCRKTCSKACASDEVCTIDDAGNAACTKVGSFDAGPLTFSGTTTQIKLTPPYAFKSSGNGAPFTAGADLRVKAEGAASAGFEAFDEAFTATTFVQTAPALTTITREQVYGTGSVPVSWTAGDDAIFITLAGRGGTVTCKAEDADGIFDVPRAAFTAAIGGEPEFAMTLSVTRQRRETKKGYKTKGELTNATVQSEGWLDLVTMSTESTRFQACADLASMCGAGCVNIKSDKNNCGGCGNVCAGATVCSAGACVAEGDACDHCITTSEAGMCKAKLDVCKADAACNGRWTCESSCQTDQCSADCKAQYPASELKWDAFLTCLDDECGFLCQ